VVRDAPHDRINGASRFFRRQSFPKSRAADRRLFRLAKGRTKYGHVDAPDFSGSERDCESTRSDFRMHLRHTAIFEDRIDAGRRLARKLGHYVARPDALVLGLPRGGVPVAFEIAKTLQAPLDIFLVRKLGVPGQEELAMGAVATGNVRVLDQIVIRALAITEADIDRVTQTALRELSRREEFYRGQLPGLEVRDRSVILVDDGLATGASMRAASIALKQRQPARTTIAVPVSSREACEELRNEVDEIVCAEVPPDFRAVGQWYEDFAEVSDVEVRAILETAQRHLARL
jgi:putative phosphoribosyl transferase